MLEWVMKEFKTLQFSSHQLTKSFLTFFSRIADNPFGSILAACEGRAGAKAGYRLLANEALSIEEVHRSHLDAMDERVRTESVLLAIQDTSYVNYAGHKKTEGMGYAMNNSLGIAVHSCIAVTPEGTPVGLLAQSYVTRDNPKDTRSHEEKRERPIEEKESFRWLETMRTASERVREEISLIHVADREGDIYELFALAEDMGEKFIIRATHDRKSLTGEHIIARVREQDAVGRVALLVPANRPSGTKERQALLHVRYLPTSVAKPQIRQKDLAVSPSVDLTLVSLREDHPPKGVEPLEWLLVTNLTVASFSDAAGIAEFYQHRWKIERFHYVLKSGCKIENIQQRSVDGIETMLLFYSIIAIQIMLLTYTARCSPLQSCENLLAESEWKLLYRVANRTSIDPDSPYSIQDAVKYIARLGGHAGAPSDGPPGLKSIWSGMIKLSTLHAYRDFLGSGGSR